MSGRRVHVAAAQGTLHKLKAVTFVGFIPDYHVFSEHQAIDLDLWFIKAI